MGNDLSVSGIIAQIEEYDCRHIVLTGGEPMLFAELIPLCAELKSAGKHITIETAGTLYLPLECDLMSLSPKFASSTPSIERAPKWHRRHEQTRHAADVIRRLTAEYTYQYKFVVDTPADCQEVERYLQEFPEIDIRRVMLMPQGITLEVLTRTATWLEPYCQSNGFHYCARKQIEWYGLVPGT